MMETFPTVTEFAVIPVVAALWAAVGARAGVQVPAADDAASAGTAATRAPPPMATDPAITEPASRPRRAWPPDPRLVEPSVSTFPTATPFRFSRLPSRFSPGRG